MPAQADDGSANFNIGFWILTGLGVVGFMVGGMLAWATMTAISGAVVAPGFVSVESKIKMVQHAEGGIVAEIFVREGDIVTGGDLVLRLDATDLRASYAIVAANVNDLYGQRARLMAERDGAEKVTFPEALLQAAGNDEVAAKVIASQTAAFEARRSNRQGQIHVLRQKIAQITQEIKGLEAQQEARNKQLEIAGADLETIKPLLKTGNTTRQRVMTLEREVASLTGDVGKTQSDIARTRAAAEETELQILQLEKDFQEKVSRDLQDIQAKIPELEEKRQALAAKLKLVEIRAPASGMVMNLSVFTVGGVVTPAREIMQIVPQGDQLVVEARISPADLDQVKIGQDVFVRVTAFESSSTPVLNGTVVMVSGAQIVDPQTRAPYVNVNVEIPKHEVARLRSNQKLRPGLPAEAYIRTSNRTVLDYLTKPLWDQIMRAWRER
ncbi:MAG: HlyD family type I secretion periplasmic adaptor subunit [Hyphomicrobiaceae bacterium]